MTDPDMTLKRAAASLSNAAENLELTQKRIAQRRSDRDLERARIQKEDEADGRAETDAHRRFREAWAALHAFDETGGAAQQPELAHGGPVLSREQADRVGVSPHGVA